MDVGRAVRGNKTNMNCTQKIKSQIWGEYIEMVLYQCN